MKKNNEIASRLVPPHTAVFANEDRDKFNRLHEANAAKFRPAGPAEEAVVRQLTELQWKIERNNSLETAMYNRELLRLAPLVKPSLPELADVELCLAAQEALTGNRTIAEMRKQTGAAIRLISHLQRQLKQLQRDWPAAPEPPKVQRPAKTVQVNGRITENVKDVYRGLYPNRPIELIARELPADRPLRS